MDPLPSGPGSPVPSGALTASPTMTSVPFAALIPQSPFYPQTRKITIRNLKVTPQSISDAYITATSTKLRNAVKTILEQGVLRDSLEDLYRGVENLVREGKGEELYKMLDLHCREFVRVRLNPEIENTIERDVPVGGDGGITVVTTIQKAWGRWTSQVGMIQSIFYYLDRAYILASTTLASITDLGNQAFKEYILLANHQVDRYVTGILTLVRKDRDGEILDGQLLHSSVMTLTTLGLYESNFAVRLATATQEHYRAEAERLASEMTLANYLRHVALRIQQEESRCLRHNFSEPDVMNGVHELITKIYRDLLDSGFKELVDKNDVDSLSTLHEFSIEANEKESTAKFWGDYIKEKGEQLVSNPDDDENMIPNLLAFKAKLDTILKISFDSDDLYSQVLRESFEVSINRRRDKPAEYIAKYLDTLLKKGDRGFTSTTGDSNHLTVEQELERALVLFRFVHGKDIFEAFYKKDLAKRLLLGRSASSDSERSMIAKLRTECGSQFTQKLEGMFKDMDLSNDMNKSFKEQRHATAVEKNLHVNVLSQAFWPTYLEKDVILPESMLAALESFKEFYLRKQTGRKLMWRHLLGHCILNAHFPLGKKELNVSLFQGVVLLLFNSGDNLSYPFIQGATNLEDRELERTLQSLACGKFRVLTKSSKGRDIHVTDTFSVNKNFTSPLHRIKINQIQVRETPQEQRETLELVERDRQFEIQATIVRIMKSRKSIRHHELMVQVIDQTKNRGTLDVAEIKKNIDRLIEKEYMERAEGSRDVYNYIT